VTSDIVDEVMGKAMPGFAGNDAGADRELIWGGAAEKLLATVADPAIADNIRLRAVKRGRRDHSATVMPKHVTPFLDLADSDRPAWSAAALARVVKVPQMVRETVKAGIEDLALERGLKEITLELAEEGVAEARKAMCPVPAPEDELADEIADEIGDQSRDEGQTGAAASAPSADRPVTWTDEAESRLARVPEGVMREMTRQRVESMARRTGAESVTLDLLEEKYAGWAKGSEKRQAEMAWDPQAASRVARIPDFIRPMVVSEIERCARALGLDVVNGAAIDKAAGSWESLGAFHSESAPGQYEN
jgi:hypothetical protein